MSKTADLVQSIWSDPWFLRLPVEAKALYLWAISNEHSNLAGLYVVARPLIEFELGLRGKRFDRALAALDGKLLFHEPTGAVWVVGRAKRVRSKTTQIAKSISKAVQACPYGPYAEAFCDKHAEGTWFSQGLGEVRQSLNGSGSGSGIA